MTALPVLYSFRRCPYAIRARLALAVAGVAVELREILLKDKPAAMLRLSAKGTVPVLQRLDGQVLDESIDIMHWALAQHDPQGWVRPEESAARAELIRQNDGPFKHWLDRYKYHQRFPEQDRLAYRAEAERILQEWESRLGAHGGGLLRAEWGLADYALLPFVRQFAHSDDRWFEQAPYPELRRWLQRFESGALFARVMPKWPLYVAGQAGVTVDWQPVVA